MKRPGLAPADCVADPKILPSQRLLRGPSRCICGHAESPPHGVKKTNECFGPAVYGITSPETRYFLKYDNIMWKSIEYSFIQIFFVLNQ
jgi:hypothetical protein